MAKKNAEAAEAETNTAAVADAPKEAKSIVPKKYAGKYKGGGSDDLARFIKQEAGEGDKFNWDSFWLLCRKNGIADEQVNKYQEQVSADAHGAKGRARMTLGNMLRAKARKNGKLIKLDDTEDAVSVAAVAVSGAAAKAQETAAATEEVADTATDDGADVGDQPAEATEASD